MLVTGETYEIRIEDMGQNGEGIGRAEGIAVFVTGAVAGDLCLVEITRVKKNFAFGRAVSVTEPSPYRREPVCQFAGQCGGCSLSTMTYEGQLRLKEKQVRESLIRIGGVKNPPVLPILGMAEPFHYRNHGQFPVGPGENGPAVGFFGTKSHNIVDCPHCMLQSAPAMKAAEVIRRYIRESGVSVYEEKTGKGTLRHLIVRNAEGTGEVMVVLVVNQGKLPMQREFLQWLKEGIEGLNHFGTAFSEGGREGGAEKTGQKTLEEAGAPGKAPKIRWRLRCLALNINKGRGNRVLGDKTVFLYGQERITDVFEGLEYFISPASFYQVNTQQTKVLYRKVKEFAALTGTETVFDLYCGVGTISLYLTDKAKQVIGIEAVKDAVLDANRSAIRNGIVNAMFTCGRAEFVLPEMVEKGSRAQVVVLDPPRGGCDRRLLDAVIRAKADKIVYVSCNPATMARDVRYLGEHGYAVKQVQPVDLFPWTVHVETVVLLSKLNAKQHIEVELNLDELDLTAAERKPPMTRLKPVC